MALHSSTERFGVAVFDPTSSTGTSAVEVFDDGRGLSNTLITRVSAMVPRERWTNFNGLAVATGPGGFTGTRLSVVMARTLAEQLRCPLLGISSFALMAPRLHNQLPERTTRSAVLDCAGAAASRLGGRLLLPRGR
jgi:tRNA threonylcarbamoyl adenosine modification protein YeaZ